MGLYNFLWSWPKTNLESLPKDQIQEWVKSTPKNLQRLPNKIHKKWGIKASKDTIKRVIKSMNQGWYRLKKKVGGEPLAEFEHKKIIQLLELL